MVAPQVDFTIVVTSLLVLCTESSGLSFFTALRVLRALKPLRMVSRSEGMMLVARSGATHMIRRGETTKYHQSSGAARSWGKTYQALMSNDYVDHPDDGGQWESGDPSLRRVPVLVPATDPTDGWSRAALARLPHGRQQ